MTLNWVAPDDDDITGYQVLRRHPGEAEGSMVESVLHVVSTATTYTDAGLHEDVLHAYAVRAVNAAGVSERSNYDNTTPHRVTSPDPGVATVYLTFDDGPGPEITDEIIDILATYGARAIFFVTGRNTASHPDVIARMAAERHGIGNHAWSHENLANLTWEPFASTVMRTQEQIGAHASPCLRHPYGASNSITREWASSLGLRAVGWKVDPKDYLGPGVDWIVFHLSSNVEPGSIVLLHEGEQTAEALKILLPRWSRLGYQFKPVCERPDIPVLPPNQRAAGAPTISGSPQVGQTLVADTSTIADDDGMGGASFSYHWLANNEDLAGATGAS